MTERRASAVVLATEVPAVRAIVKDSSMLQPLEVETDGLDVTLPFAVLRVWLDQPCLPSRPPFAGTAGIGILDSITIYDRIEGESERWARAHGGSVVELHGYAVDPARDEPSLRAELLANLHTLYPETKNARILHDRFLLRRDCPSFAPGSHSSRPGVETTVPGVVLAGDYVKLPFPSALMERAVTSGFLAANSLLRSFGLPVHAVAESPRRGLLRQPRMRA